MNASLRVSPQKRARPLESAVSAGPKKSVRRAFAGGRPVRPALTGHSTLQSVHLHRAPPFPGDDIAPDSNLSPGRRDLLAQSDRAAIGRAAFAGAGRGFAGCDTPGSPTSIPSAAPPRASSTLP